MKTTRYIFLPLYIMTIMAIQLLYVNAQAYSRWQKELPIIADGVSTHNSSGIDTQNTPVAFPQNFYGSWQYDRSFKTNGAIYAFGSLNISFNPPNALGGSFDSINGILLNSIVQSQNGFQALGNGVNGPVYAVIEINSGSNNNQYYAGGNFDSAGGAPAKNIAFWDGAQWHAVGAGVDSTVLAFAEVGNTLYVGGNFRKAGGDTANYIAALSLSDQQWHPLIDGNVNGVNGGVAALYNNPSDTILYVGGGFTTAGRINASKIAVWSGTQWNSLGNGIHGKNSYVACINNFSNAGIPFGGSPLAVCGEFDTAGYVVANNIATWDTAWHSLGKGTNNGVSGPAYAVLQFPFMTVVTGNFTKAGDSLANNIAIWYTYAGPSATWNPLLGGLNGPGYVLSGGFGVTTTIGGDIGGNIYVGGGFTETNNSSSPGFGYFQFSIPNAVHDPSNSENSSLSLQNYPNPFSNSEQATTISYTIPSYQRVQLKIFDRLGRNVATLINGEQDVGVHSVPFNASGLHEGAYFCRLQAGNEMQTRILVVE